jgi:hypothetical protein
VYCLQRFHTKSNCDVPGSVPLECPRYWFRPNACFGVAWRARTTELAKIPIAVSLTRDIGFAIHDKVYEQLSIRRFTKVTTSTVGVIAVVEPRHCRRRSHATTPTFAAVTTTAATVSARASIATDAIADNIDASMVLFPPFRNDVQRYARAIVG